MAYFGGPPAPYPGAYTNPAAYAAAAGYGAMPNMMGGPMPPMMAPAPTNVPPLLPTDEVRTVFITGFPNDIKERELNNLLRFIPGYEASQMNWKNGQAQGFALFINGSAARAACDQIAGLCFDENVLLRAEMARKNMYIKVDPANGPLPIVAGKRVRTAGSYSGSYGGSGGGAPGSGPVGYAPVSNTRDNPPCNTLFIGNLGEAVDDTELSTLFSSQPGFTQIKVLRVGRSVSCFVEFDRVEDAAACHSTQQGAVLRSSERGGIRIQFSKNPFGKKRDANGQLVDARLSGGAAMGGAPPGMALAGYDGMPGGAAFDPSSAGTPVLPFDPAAAANAGLQ